MKTDENRRKLIVEQLIIGNGITTRQCSYPATRQCSRSNLTLYYQADRELLADPGATVLTAELPALTAELHAVGNTKFAFRVHIESKTCWGGESKQN